MVNNYPEYAAGVNYKKTDSEDVTHFYSAQVVADPSDDTIESKLIKDGVVISEGGGGSSDFSTAEVKFINSEAADSYYRITVAAISEENCILFDEFNIATEKTLVVPLYKGKTKIRFHIDDVTEDEPVLTGGVSLDEEFEFLTITGNGTFTAKAAAGN